MIEASSHIHLNGLSIGGGGGYTVGFELLRHLAFVRPDWRVSISLTEASPLHEEMRRAQLPLNASILWAPAVTSGQLARRHYESGALPSRLAAAGVTALVQLNGQLVPALPFPTLCHFQDPFPYRPDLLTDAKARLLAIMRRRLHARALRRAHAIGFTSGYLRDLICRFHGVSPTPPRVRVLYNGVSEAGLARARGALPDWDTRPLELVTVSNVAEYKQQHLVVRALAELRRRPALAGLTYRIVGECSPADRATMERLAQELGIAGAVTIEGRVPPERVEWAYARARCFVLMSRCESFGLPAIEAMTFGTPVVAADGSALPEIVGEAGIIVPMRGVETLVDGVARALDPAQAHELRERGRHRVQAFPWQSTAEAIAEWASAGAKRGPTKPDEDCR